MSATTIVHTGTLVLILITLSNYPRKMLHKNMNIWEKSNLYHTWKHSHKTKVPHFLIATVSPVSYALPSTTEPYVPSPNVFICL